MENAVGFVRRDPVVPVPSAEGWEASGAAWIKACDRIASRDHYRRDVPIEDLFAVGLDRMRPLPGVVFDACDWRQAKADKTGTVMIDSNRYGAGPRWHGLRLNVGVRASGIELRGPDGETITTFERVWGHDPNTRVDPSGLLAIIARKPRARGESPIRGDFPENVGVLLDRMNGSERRGLIDDIRRASSVSGFAAATRAASMIIDAGRRLDASSIDQLVRRVNQGGPATNGRDLKRYDTYMEERWAPVIRKSRARGADGP